MEEHDEPIDCEESCEICEELTKRYSCTCMKCEDKLIESGFFDEK